MTFYGDYTTRAILKSQYLDVTASTDDALLTDIITDVSRQIDHISVRRFAPLIATRAYDTPQNFNAWTLLLDDDLMTLTTLTNGDGTAIAAGNYKLTPLNEQVKERLILLKSSGLRFEMSPTSDPEGAISVLGVWGYVKDGGWVNTNGTLQANITDSATSLTATTGKINVGDLLKIDDEYVYVTAVTVGATDTGTIVRAANGSTAAAHTATAILYRWQPDQNISMLCQQAGAAAYRLRANPAGDTIMIDGVSFVTPKDVTAFLYKRLTGLGMKRQVIG
jgi:hypothetical protein